MAAVIFSALGGSFAGGGAATVLTPALAYYQKQLNKQYKPVIPTPNELVAMRMRGQIEKSMFTEYMLQNGVPELIGEQLFRTAFALSGLQSTVIRFRRKQITEEQAYAEAEIAGMPPHEFAKLLSSSLEQASPQDLIRMLVREVFTPEIRAKFQQDAEYPPEADAEASRIGMPSELLRNLWAAHWELPSARAYQEMLYRFSPEDKAQWEPEMKEMGIKTDQLETTLDIGRLLYRTQDVMPFWRERMIAISYQPLTRVDVRRMIRLKIITPAQVLYAFKSLGYSTVNARRLMWFSFIYESLPDWIAMLKDAETTIETIKGEMVEWGIPANIMDNVVKRKLIPATQAQIKDEKAIAKSEINKAYIGGLIDRLQAIEYLKALNYTEDNAKFLIELWDFLAQPARKAERDLSLTQQRDLWKIGEINDTEFKVRLINMRYSEAEADEIIAIEKAKIAAAAAKEKK